MNFVDNLLSGAQNIYKQLGVDTEKNSRLINNSFQQLGKALSSVDLSTARKNFGKVLNIQQAEKSFQDFKEGVVGTLKPKGTAILLGAILGGGGATVYNLMKNRRHSKEYERAPQLKYAANLGRLYSGAVLGGLAGLLLNKYRNKLQNAAANWFTKHKEYL